MRQLMWTSRSNTSVMKSWTCVIVVAQSVNHPSLILLTKHYILLRINRFCASR